MDALTKLNEACVEAGVCEPKIRHAVELWKDGMPHKIILACFDDGAVTSCVIETESERRECCFTAEKGGPELMYSWEAHLTSPQVGYKIKRIEVEK